MANERRDIYRTIKSKSKEVLYKVKGSKFFGYAFPVQTETDVHKLLEEIRNKHHKARHWCYAYSIGVGDVKYRVNDDGEPSNTAGQPIYGQILSADLNNILIVVVRYFGGVKLGVGGLISAYKSTAKMAIEESLIVQRTIDDVFKIKCSYEDLDKILRLLSQLDLKILKQNMEMDCEIEVAVRQSKSPKFLLNFEQLRVGRIEKKN